MECIPEASWSDAWNTSTSYLWWQGALWALSPSSCWMCELLTLSLRPNPAALRSNHISTICVRDLFLSVNTQSSWPLVKGQNVDRPEKKTYTPWGSALPSPWYSTDSTIDVAPNHLFFKRLNRKTWSAFFPYRTSLCLYLSTHSDESGG